MRNENLFMEWVNKNAYLINLKRNCGSATLWLEMNVFNEITKTEKEIKYLWLKIQKEGTKSN